MRFLNKYSLLLLKILNFLTFLQIIKAQEACVTPANVNGFCVPYRECPFVNELAQSYGSLTRIPPYYLDFIRKSQCSSSNQPIRLCCELKNSTPETVTQKTRPVTQAVNMGSRFTEDLDYSRDYLSQLNTQGFNILNELACGKPLADRVAGGNRTELNEYPWMALLRYDSLGDEFKCGGSLITNRFVLTAAHCVNSATYPVIGVRLGEHDISTSPDCKQRGRKRICNPPQEDLQVEDVIIHPKYNERRRINDIALIKLNRNVVIQRHISPICLPITPASFQLNSDEFFISGWGSTENGPKSNVLLKAAVSKKDGSVCQNSFRIEINEKHICAGDLATGRDTCRGDSGGPLIGLNTYKTVKRFVQYGLVASGGVACNLEQALPGIYTNIITFMPWITSNIV